MQTPWFLQYLELTLEADAAGIKQAYGLRLKQIDHMADMKSFMRLGEAYRLALDWAARHTANIATESTARSPAPQPSASPAREPSGPTASRAMALLVERLSAGQPAKIALHEQLQSLKQGHVQSPAMFELMIIDGLSSSRLPQRLALFQAAYEPFQWSDESRLAQLGPRGQWIITALAEFNAWKEISRAVGGDLLERISEGAPLQRSELTAADIPAPVALRWPDARRLLDDYPRYLALRCDAGLADAWKQAFDALPGRDRALAEAFASAPSPAAFRRLVPRNK